MCFFAVEAPQIVVIEHGSKKNEVDFEFSALQDAKDYLLVSVVDNTGHNVEGVS